ncbi:MAG: paraquat-inducible protein A [Alphaproteobacteria bacterium]|nr:paraquat-inducible protein A [Alphaproteobacteria bacterium]
MTSLADRFPRHTIALAVLWALAAMALAAGLALPAVRVTRLRLVEETVSVLSGIAELWQGGSWPLAIVIALFSVAFPVAKLALAAWLWFAPAARRGALHALAAGAGKWSMLDVLVVAVVVASMQGGFLVRLRPEVGIYLFGASTLLATLVTWVIDRRRRAVDGDA